MNEKQESNKSVITIVVMTLAVNATIGVSSLAFCLISGRDLNTALLTAFVGIVNYVLGAVSGMLVKTAPTNSTSTSGTTDNPTKTEIVNKEENPVPTTDQPERKP